MYAGGFAWVPSHLLFLLNLHTSLTGCMSWSKSLNPWELWLPRLKSKASLTQFPQAEQWLALLLPGSATPDKPLSISVPWFTSPEKGNHSSDIGFKSTVLLLVFYLSGLCFVYLLLFLCLLLESISFMFLLCLLCWLISYNSLVCFIGCFRVYNIGC